MIKKKLFFYSVFFVLTLNVYSQNADTIALSRIDEIKALFKKNDIRLEGKSYYLTPEFIIQCNKKNNLINLEENLLTTHSTFLILSKNNNHPRYNAHLYVYKNDCIAKNKLNQISSLLKKNENKMSIMKCLKGQKFFIYKNILFSVRCFHVDFNEKIKAIIGEYPIHYSE